MVCQAASFCYLAVTALIGWVTRYRRPFFGMYVFILKVSCCIDFFCKLGLLCDGLQILYIVLLMYIYLPILYVYVYLFRKYVFDWLKLVNL